MRRMRAGRAGTPGRATGHPGPGGAGAPIQALLEAEAFSGLRVVVLAAGGIDLDLYKERFLLRRITIRQRACGASTLRAYLKLVGQNPVERGRLVRALTIHVSQFFRNPSTFRAIQGEVLPALLTRRQAGGRPLRLWSVGCACGEEPYSLAILLLEDGTESRQTHSSTIYATDIDPTSLHQAREGRYPAASLATLPAPWRKRYFTREADRYLVGPEARRLVFLKLHNILEPVPFGRIDLILCRNVLIYMNEVLQGRVLQALVEALNPGGFLVLGKVEGLTGPARDLLELVNVPERIYRKPEWRLR
ncbi:MAG TPA: protein-glutamate O-methyltransferase CheR [Candidatus Methylomirabilis sp.]